MSKHLPSLEDWRLAAQTSLQAAQKRRLSASPHPAEVALGVAACIFLAWLLVVLVWMVG